MGKHYVQLTVTVGKSDFERVYIEIEPEDELEVAVDAWLDEQIAGRVRNRDKARRAVAARIESARICRPTSWYMARYEEMGLDAAAGQRPNGRKIRRRGR